MDAGYMAVWFILIISNQQYILKSVIRYIKE